MAIDISKLRARPQSQASLKDQMAALIQVANRLGLYDAADRIKRDQELRGLAERYLKP